MKGDTLQKGEAKKKLKKTDRAAPTAWRRKELPHAKLGLYGQYWKWNNGEEFPPLRKLGP